MNLDLRIPVANGLSRKKDDVVDVWFVNPTPILDPVSSWTGWSF